VAAYGVVVEHLLYTHEVPGSNRGQVKGKTFSGPHLEVNAHAIKIDNSLTYNRSPDRRREKTWRM